MAVDWTELNDFLESEYNEQAGIYAIQPYDNLTFVIGSQAEIDFNLPTAFSEYGSPVVVVLVCND